MMARHFRVGGFVVLVLSILYAVTAARTVGPGDSGELTSVMVSLPVASSLDGRLALQPGARQC